LCPAGAAEGDAAARIADVFHVSDDFVKIGHARGDREIDGTAVTISVDKVWFLLPSGEQFEQELRGPTTIGGIRSAIAEKVSVDDLAFLRFQ
jgi:hypothetical protein